MPRIRQYADRYAEEDFKKELFRKMADRYEQISVRALARETGISHSALNVKIRSDNTNLDIGELRRIVPILNPDPGILLKLLGYTPAQIKRFKES